MLKLLANLTVEAGLVNREDIRGDGSWIIRSGGVQDGTKIGFKLDINLASQEAYDRTVDAFYSHNLTALIQTKFNSETGYDIFRTKLVKSDRESLYEFPNRMVSGVVVLEKTGFKPTDDDYDIDIISNVLSTGMMEVANIGSSGVHYKKTTSVKGETRDDNTIVFDYIFELQSSYDVELWKNRTHNGEYLAELANSWPERESGYVPTRIGYNAGSQKFERNNLNFTMVNSVDGAIDEEDIEDDSNSTLVVIIIVSCVVLIAGAAFFILGAEESEVDDGASDDDEKVGGKEAAASQVASV